MNGIHQSAISKLESVSFKSKTAIKMASFPVYYLRERIKINNLFKIIHQLI